MAKRRNLRHKIQVAIPLQLKTRANKSQINYVRTWNIVLPAITLPDIVGDTVQILLYGIEDICIGFYLAPRYFMSYSRIYYEIGKSLA